VTAIFDPDTGDTGQELAPVTLTPFAAALLPYAGGEKMLVLDQLDDRLLLVE
jgi:hypothetical protein